MCETYDGELVFHIWLRQASLFPFLLNKFMLGIIDF